MNNMNRGFNNFGGNGFNMLGNNGMFGGNNGGEKINILFIFSFKF